MKLLWISLAICASILLVGIGLCGTDPLSPIGGDSVLGAALIVLTVFGLLGTLVAMWKEKHDR